MGMGRAVRGMQFDKLPQPDMSKERILRILRYFVPYIWRVLLIFLTIVAGSCIGLLPPLLTRGIIDNAITKGDIKLLNLLSAATIVVSVCGGLINVGQTYLNAWISQRIIVDMRNQMYRKLQSMSIAFYTKTKTGEILSRLNNDIGGIEGVISGTVVQIVTNFITLVTTLFLIFAFNWKLACLSVVILPMFILPTRKVGRYRWEIASKTQAKIAEMSSFAQESLSISGALLTKVFDREPERISEYSQKNSELMSLHIKQQMAGRWLFMCLHTFTSLGPALIYWYGGRLVIGDELTLGTVVAFVAYLNRLYGPVQSLSNVYVELVRSLALFDRIFEYFDMAPEITDGPMEMKDIKGRMEFKGVSFGYEENKKALSDVSFKVEPGQTVALVGPSGAGKSTVTYLVARFYDPTNGFITLDGTDLRDITLSSLRRNIGMVTQESYLFHGTVRENLQFAKPGATDAEMEDACRKANIHDLIIGLPEGYDTIVGERGFKLSGGEKQRLAIARVILKDPKILILDEATSALDSVSEALIQQALEPLLKGRTCFVIAHRLSTILDADKILVIQNGTVAEQGTHSELLELDGLYTKLYNEQFKVNEAVS